MSKRAVVAGMLASMAITLAAQKPAWEPAPGHSQLPIWPHGAPGSGSNPGPGAAAEVDTTTAKDNLIAGKPLIRLGNVSTPTITVYKAPGASGAVPAVVVFPGGGYRILAIDLEGTEVCDWLNSAGVTCVLLKYRVPDSGPYPKSPAALAGCAARCRAGSRTCGRMGNRSEPGRGARVFRRRTPGRSAEYAF